MKLVWRQLRASGPLGVVASVGLLLAVVLLATGPLYTATLERLAYDQALTSLRSTLHPQIYLGFSSFSEEEYRGTRSDIVEAAKASFGDAFIEHGVYASAGIMNTQLVEPPGFLQLSYFQYRTDLAEHVLIEGRLPEAAGAEGPIEVAIGRDAAETVLVTVGQVLRQPASPQDPRPSFETKIVGIVEPINPDENYWLAQSGPYFEAFELNNRWVMPLFVPEETLVNRVGANAPAFLGNVNDFLYLDRAVVLDQGPNGTESMLLDMQGRLASAVPRAALIAGLEREVEVFNREMSKVRIPLVILLVLVEAIALYSLGMVAIALSGRQQNSVALVRSRGAGLFESAGMVLLWGLTVLAATMVLAPLVAGTVVIGLGYTPSWETVLGSEILRPASLLPTVPWVVAGAFLAGGLLLLPTARVARTPLAVLRTGRGASRGNGRWVQRLLLDSALLAVAGVLLWQLDQREGLATTGTSGEISVDRVALLIPALTIVIALMLFFRLLPLIVRIGGLATRVIGLLGASLAFERMGRAPGSAIGLGGLLLLVATLGTFAATFGGTLDKSADDFASHSSGGDAFVYRPEGYANGDFAGVRERFTQLPGVTDASAAYTTKAGIGTLTPGTLVPLLAVDPSTAGNVLWFRNDFSDERLGEILVNLSLLEGDRTPARAIPDDAETIGVWVRADNPSGKQFIWLHLIDGLGRPHTYSMGALDFEGWRLVEQPLGRGEHDPPPGPYTLDSILVFENALGSSGAPGMIHLDDLQYRDRDGMEHVIDTFDRPEEWLPILTSGDRRDYVGAANATGHHETALEFAWGRETLDGVRGLYVSPQLSTVPMYASSRLQEVLGLSVGRERALHISGRVIPFRIVGTLDQFPTIPETNAGFAIAHGPSLMTHVNAVAVTAVKEKKPIWPNQVFLTLSGDEAAQETTLLGIVEDTALTGTVVDAATVSEERRRSPLASASWRGLVVMAVVAALIALATGISAHAIASAQDRSGDMALMRALGLSRVNAMVAFLTEHVAIVGLAVVSGVAVGLWLATVLVPLFQGLGAAPVVPSLIVTTEWNTVGTMVGAVLVGGLVGAAVLWRVYISVPMAGILRIGNE
jgi:hypothetical protein